MAKELHAKLGSQIYNLLNENLGYVSYSSSIFSIYTSWFLRFIRTTSLHTILFVWYLPRRRWFRVCWRHNEIHLHTQKRCSTWSSQQCTGHWNPSWRSSFEWYYDYLLHQCRRISVESLWSLNILTRLLSEAVILSSTRYFHIMSLSHWYLKPQSRSFDTCKFMSP